MSLYQQFYQLHHNDAPLLIGNAWDAGSAISFQQAGFKAIATSSAAVANTFGYEDGENIPFELLLQTAEHIYKHINVPLSVDIEAGYSNTINGIIENVDRLYDTGAVGFNIEDASQKELRGAGEFAKIIEAVANHLAQKNMGMYINARTDAFLLKHPDALAQTVERARLYEQAGAGGIFAPFVHDEGDMAAIVQATRLPLNVLAMPQLPAFSKLAELGVKRISIGSAMYRRLTGILQQTLQGIQQQQSFNALYI
jgi:2-methylisocitrate lyase-like PEP mutase family enzyme